MKKYFSYTCNGFELHDTEEQARQHVESALCEARSNAAIAGWGYGVSTICWGEVRQVAEMAEQTGESTVDFVLVDVHIDILKELRSASEKVASLRDLVMAEMEQKGNQGKLWRNDMCAAWPGYLKAIQAQDKLRSEHGV